MRELTEDEYRVCILGLMIILITSMIQFAYQFGEQCVKAINIYEHWSPVGYQGQNPLPNVTCTCSRTLNASLGDVATWNLSKAR
jgi:hypothetical protein